MTNTPITDHWWNRENFNGDDREVGRLVSLKGLLEETGIKEESETEKLLKSKLKEYEKAWEDRGPSGEVSDPNILRRIWLYRGSQSKHEHWVRIWEVEEVRRWMSESTDYQDLSRSMP